ncbi:MAG: methyltransferase domain-containing protein, partial [Nitrososphaerota archaeon]
MERFEGPVIGSRIRRWIQNPYKLLALLELGRGQSFLDIGCGRGFLTLPAAHIVGAEGRVYAVDTSAKYLTELRKRVKSLNLSNVSILETDASELDGVLHKSVDKAAMMLSLHHIERKRTALTVLREKLREGSSILVVD